MKKIIACILSLAVLINVSMASTEDAAAPRYPEPVLTDNTARLGLAFAGAYTLNGITVLKVSEVLQGSPLSGILKPGDLVYGIDGFNLRGIDDLHSVIYALPPGSPVTVYYFDPAKDFAAMQVKVTTTTAQALDDAAKAEQSPAPPEKADQGFCSNHPVACTLGGLAAAVGLWAAVRSGSRSSSDQSDTGSSDTADPLQWDDYARRQQQSEQQGQDSVPAPRSYGFYGDCPAPGMGYGC